MPLVTTSEILRQAQFGGYAIGAFNVENAEMAQAVCSAAQHTKMSVILQTTPSTLRYLPPACFAGIVKAMTEQYNVTAALHLDPGDSYELACTCIEAGYTSVMIDGSKLDFEENIALTQKVVEYAHAQGIPVEAELGTVGGKEDDTESSGDGYTNPQQAASFVKRTGVDSLAIGFGTAHGFYTTPPVLDLKRIRLVRDEVSIPLVMHGTSGISTQDVQTAIRNGICKVNYATELREAFTKGVQAYFAKDATVIDPKKYLSQAKEYVALLVQKRIGDLSSLCGMSR